MNLLRRLARMFSGEAQYVEAVNAQLAAMDRIAERNAERCEICNGTAVYLCPDCRRPITMHSHENDYLCDCPDPRVDPNEPSSCVSSMGRFVTPIRESDGAFINGTGRVM